MLLEILLVLLALFGLIFLYLLIFTKPSNNRDWSKDQKILPFAKIKDELITVYNIRNFQYKSTYEYAPDYYNKTFNLDKIKSIDFVLEPFNGHIGAAHTLLSFGFEDNEYLAVSVEIRKKGLEQFSALKGLFNSYEIMYVVADERDVVQLRSNYRKNKVYVYPIKNNKKERQQLFIEIINKINKLKKEPEFYNTITNACAINIIRHINTSMSHKIPLSYKILFPAYFDKLALKLGLIDTELSLKEAREKFLINERAEKYNGNKNFSKLIRE